MKKGAIVALVFAAVMVLCGIGLTASGFLSSSSPVMYHQYQNGFMMRMSYTSSMPMAFVYGGIWALKLIILGCSLFVGGIILLALGIYLLIKAGSSVHSTGQPEVERTQKKASKPRKPSTKDVEDAVIIEEKEEKEKADKDQE